MVVNSTKWDALELIAGTDDSDDWRGLSIALTPGRTTFQGRTVNCIVVKSVPKTKKRPAQPDPDIDEDPADESQEASF